MGRVIGMMEAGGTGWTRWAGKGGNRSRGPGVNMERSSKLCGRWQSPGARPGPLLRQAGLKCTSITKNAGQTSPGHLPSLSPRVLRGHTGLAQERRALQDWLRGPRERAPSWEAGGDLPAHTPVLEAPPLSHLSSCPRLQEKPGRRTTWGPSQVANF